MKNTIRRCLNLLLGILILAGCSNPVLERIETPASNGTGEVSVRIGTVEGQFEDAARTLAPVLPAFSKYTLTFSGPEAYDAVDISSGTSVSLELTVGEWTITATAYTGETAVAQGSATVTVAAGANTPADIILTPVSGGTGTFSYSIDVPVGATGSLVVVTADGVAVPDGNITLTAGTSNANNLSLPSGQYLLSVRLTLDGKAAGRAEAVHIYPDMTTAVEYSFTTDDFGVIVSLTENIWMDDAITTSGVLKWYSFTASAGTTYQVQWNDAYQGDNTKSLDIKVSAFRDDDTSIFQPIDSGWTSPRTVSGVTGTVYLKVEAYSSGATGTYAIKYYDPTSIPPQVTMTISSVVATPVPSCVISWNYVEGVTGYRLYRSTDPDSGYTQIGADITGVYNNSYTDTNVSTGSTYYYKVAAYNDNGDGERSSAVSGTPPASSVITALSDNTWTDGEIATSGDVHWYSFTASVGTSYQVQWNDQYYGDGTYTLPYAYVSAFSAAGSYIFQQTSNGWASPSTVSGVTGTVYLRVQGSGNIGTYAIRYYDPTSMPPQAAMSISSVVATPVPSCVISWNYVNGVTGYRLYRSSNPDSSYTQIGADITGGYTSYTDTNVSAGFTYYYKVAAYNANGEGERSSAVSGTPPASSAITALSDNVWTDGDITTSGDVQWYSFTASAGTSYQVQWNAQYYGDGTYTLYAYVSAFKADGSYIFQQASNGWTSSRTVSGVTGTVYLKVEGYGNTGTYAIMYKVDDRISINVGFNYEAIAITGSDGSNAISQAANESLALSASGYTNVVWYVDGDTTGIADTGTGITLSASDYTVRIHSVTFTGKRNGNLYSQVIPFRVLD